MNISLYGLLFERETDAVVQGFINWFKTQVLTNLSEPEYQKEGYFLLYPKLKNMDLQYEKYKELSGDNSGIILRFKDLVILLEEFEIQVHPKTKRPEATADMFSSGKMRVFLPTWDYESEPTEEQKQNLLGDIKNFFASPLFLIHVLPHELGHYINAIRSGHKNKGIPVDFRAKTKTRNPALQFHPGTDEYRDSTEEIQARLVGFTEYLDGLVNTKPEEYNFLKQTDKNILSALVFKKSQEFIDSALKTDDLRLMLSFEDMFKDIDKSKRRKNVAQRVTNRLLDIFNKYKDMDKDIYKMLTPPPLPF